MNKIQCKKILQIKIKSLERALYKGEFGTPDSKFVDDRNEFYYSHGYINGLKEALKILEVK